jgi:hypothetical protein
MTKPTKTKFGANPAALNASRMKAHVIPDKRQEEGRRQALKDLDQKIEEDKH